MPQHCNFRIAASFLPVIGALSQRGVANGCGEKGLQLTKDSFSMRNLCIADRSPGTWLLCPETIGYVTNYITNRNIAFVTARPGICGPLDDLHRNKSRGLGAFHGLIPTCDRKSWSSAVSSSPLRFWGGTDGVVTTSGFSYYKMGPCSCARCCLHNNVNVHGF